MMHARLALTPALVLALVLAPIAGAQAPEWTELGTDPAGDNGPTSAAVGVTDILGGAIAVADGELLVRFDLAANSAPAGSYCWAFGFQKGNAEYFPVVCAEFAAGTHVSAVGWTQNTASSRGTQVAEAYGEFVPTGLVLHIPLAAAGLATGDRIDDMYLLTYNQRGFLSRTDNMPDAKSDAAAGESLGSYTIGASGSAPAVVYRPLDSAEVELELGGREAGTYVHNWTSGFAAVDIRVVSSGTGGGNVTVRAPSGDIVLDAALADANVTAESDAGQGAWTITVRIEDFTGNGTLTIRQRSSAIVPGAPPAGPPPATPTTPGATPSPGATPPPGNGTAAPEDGGKDTPSLGAAAVLAGLAAVAATRRRK